MSGSTEVCRFGKSCQRAGCWCLGVLRWSVQTGMQDHHEMVQVGILLNQSEFCDGNYLKLETNNRPDQIGIVVLVVVVVVVVG